MWRRLGNVQVLLHVRAYGDSPVSLAMTHMRWLHGQSGHESTGCTRSVVQCAGGLPTKSWNKPQNQTKVKIQHETNKTQSVDVCRNHRKVGVLDVLLPRCGFLRWSRPFVMVISCPSGPPCQLRRHSSGLCVNLHVLNYESLRDIPQSDVHDEK